MNTPIFPTAVDEATTERTKKLFAGLRSTAPEEELLALIEQGIALDAEDPNTLFTSLHLAASTGRTRIVNALLDRGISVNVPDKKQATPLHFAASGGHTETVNLLLDRGAGINARNKDGATPLRLAAKKDQKTVTELLIRRGADIEAPDKGGNTILFSLVTAQHKEVFDIFMSHGANLEARTLDNETLLHWTVQLGNMHAIESLLAHGINVEARTSTLQTALYNIAPLQAKLEDIILALTDKGANINVLNNANSSFFGGWLPDTLPGNKWVQVKSKLDPYKQAYEAFVSEGNPPTSAKEVYHLLCVYPLSDPKAPVDQEAHLRQIFSHAKWKNPEQAGTVIEQLSDSGMNPAWAESLRSVVSNEQSQDMTKRRAR